MRVLILEPTIQDVGPASEHGEPVMLFSHQRAHPPVFSPGFHHAVMRRLEELEYDPESDLVVLTGATVAVAVLVAAIASSRGHLRVLVWDVKAGRYVEMSLGAHHAVRS
jgi:hypothetical protein